MKKKLSVIIISILIITIAVLSILLHNSYKKYNTPYLKTMTILGQKVKILPRVYVYDVHIKSAKISRTVSDGCTNPYIFEVSDVFKKKFKETGLMSSQYFVNGEKQAYITMNFEKEGKNTRIDAKYYFNIRFDKPLEIDKGC